MPKDKTQKESLSGRCNILPLEGYKTVGLSNQPSISIKGLQEYSIAIHPGIDFYLYKSNCSEEVTSGTRPKSQDKTTDNSVSLKNCFIRKVRRKRERFVDRELRQHDFSGSSLEAATFTGCNLSGADFRHASLKDCVFNNCILKGADFRYANLQNARIVDCQLFAVNFDHCLLNQAVLESCSMKALSCYKTMAMGVRLNNSQMTNAFLDEADFSGAQLSHLILRSCSLGNTCFNNALINDCQFRFCESVLEGPDFSGSVFSTVTMENCAFHTLRLIAPD